MSMSFCAPHKNHHEPFPSPPKKWNAKLGSLDISANCFPTLARNSTLTFLIKNLIMDIEQDGNGVGPFHNCIPTEMV
jgi:hypothetical protein